MFNVKWGYPIQRPYIFLTTAPSGLGSEKQFVGSQGLGILPRS